MSTRSQQQKYSMFLLASRVNNQCKQQSKQFTILKSTPSGQHIQPQIVKDSAQKLIDCWNRVKINQSQQLKGKKNAALQCFKSKGKCQELTRAYSQAI